MAATIIENTNNPYDINLQKKFTQNIDSILGINKVDKVGVAVSGGTDSVGLLHLVMPWAQAKSIEVTVFNVDHNMRAESKEEGAYVKKLCDQFKIRFVPLHWHAGDKTSAIQERAREARYGLISECCKTLDINLLLTAHHLDDMLETYLLKKARRAGLLAMAPNITYFKENLWIARPFFNIEKKELIKYLRENNILWYEDLSNSSDKYERNKIRRQLSLKTLEEKTILTKEYSLAAAESKKINELLIKSFAEVVSIYNYGFAKININKFNGLPKEIKINLLNYILTIIGGRSEPPRYRNLVNFLALISKGIYKPITLHYCEVVSSSNDIIIYKEKRFINPVAKELTEKTRWDNRFEMLLKKEDLSRSYTVSSLTMSEYTELKKHLNLEKLSNESNNLHRNILFTLPAIKALEKVVAIPHISYYNSENLTSKVIFKPGFISRFTHFRT